MGEFSRFAGKISHVFDIIARFLVVALMVLIVGNVILRQFDYPVRGTVEWVEFLTAMSIGLALAYCAFQGGHVAVTFIVDKFNRKIQPIVGIVTDLMIIVFLGLSFWRLILYGNNLKATGQVSMTTAVPYYYFVYVLALGFLVYGLVVLGSIIDNIRKVVRQ